MIADTLEWKMRTIIAAALLFPLVAFGAESEWSLSLHTSTASGIGPRIHVASDGTIALAAARSIDDMLDIMTKGDVGAAAEYWRNEPQVCQSLTLDESDLKRFAGLIANIVNNAPNHSSLTMLDDCEDSLQYNLHVSAAGTKRSYGYTTRLECRGATSVPEWLENLVQALSKFYEIAKDCP